MKRLVLVYLLFFFLVGLGFSQGLIESILVEKDSIDVIREEMHQERVRQRNIYERRLLIELKDALDSVYETLLARRRTDAESKFEFHKRNNGLYTLFRDRFILIRVGKNCAFVFEADSLEVLLLDFNNIKKLPKDLRKLKSLKQLYWRRNSLEDVLWVRIAKISELEKLDLSQNKLSRLPSGNKKIREA